VKVLVLNASPQMDSGTTSLLINPFMEGLKEAGAEVDFYYTRKLKINNCQGCILCWIKHPGSCIYKDDMVKIIENFKKADIVVFGTPIYTDGVPGALKNIWDRLVPLMPPFLETREGHSAHVLNSDHKNAKIVLISTCGYWEEDNFDFAIEHTKTFFEGTVGKTFAGALIRPHGTALRLLKRQVNMDDIFDACKEAGIQLVKTGSIPKNLIEIVKKELLPREKYHSILNSWFKNVMNGFQKKAERKIQ
jgi:multimeric flavodoxin WrbA